MAAARPVSFLAGGGRPPAKAKQPATVTPLPRRARASEVEDKPMVAARVAVSRAFSATTTGTATIRYVDPAREDALSVALLALSVIESPEQNARVTRIVREAAKRLRGAKYLHATAITRYAATQAQMYLRSNDRRGAQREAEWLLAELVRGALLDADRAATMHAEALALLTMWKASRPKRGHHTAESILAKLLGVPLKKITNAIEKATKD